MKMTHLTICLEKKVSISSKFNYRLIAMFTLPVDLTYVRSTGFLFPLSKIGISYKDMFDLQGFFSPYPKSEFPIKQKNLYEMISFHTDYLISFFPHSFKSKIKSNSFERIFYPILGRKIENTDPLPFSDVTFIYPPSPDKICLASESPIPTPSFSADSSPR